MGISQEHFADITRPMSIHVPTFPVTLPKWLGN